MDSLQHPHDECRKISLMYCINYTQVFLHIKNFLLFTFVIFNQMWRIQKRKVLICSIADVKINSVNTGPKSGCKRGRSYIGQHPCYGKRNKGKETETQKYKRIYCIDQGESERNGEIVGQTYSPPKNMGRNIRHYQSI